MAVNHTLLSPAGGFRAVKQTLLDAATSHARTKQNKKQVKHLFVTKLSNKFPF